MNVRVLALAAASVFSIQSLPAASLDDIQYWVGSGANRAGLVVDWNDGKGPESLMWGYRWDGAATGLDMFQAVVNADTRLFAHLGTYVWGTATLGIGYDLNASGNFGVSPALAFNPGGIALTTSPDDSRAAADANDHYREGWNFGYWAYFTKGDSLEAWASSMVGSGDRALSNNSWDGYSFAANFAEIAPDEPVAATVVPEPASFTLVLTGGLLLACARRRQS